MIDVNRIRELRKREKMTQKELANHLKIADSTLSYWEMGKYEPDNESLINLSRFFQVPVDYIIGGDFEQWEVSEGRVRYADDDWYGSLAAFRRYEFDGLAQEEIDKLAEYAKFLKTLRKE